MGRPMKQRVEDSGEDDRSGDDDSPTNMKFGGTRFKLDKLDGAEAPHDDDGDVEEPDPFLVYNDNNLMHHHPNNRNNDDPYMQTIKFDSDTTTNRNGSDNIYGANNQRPSQTQIIHYHGGGLPSGSYHSRQSQSSRKSCHGYQMNSWYYDGDQEGADGESDMETDFCDWFDRTFILPFSQHGIAPCSKHGKKNKNNKKRKTLCQKIQELQSSYSSHGFGSGSGGGKDKENENVHVVSERYNSNEFHCSDNSNNNIISSTTNDQQDDDDGGGSGIRRREKQKQKQQQQQKEFSNNHHEGFDDDDVSGTTKSRSSFCDVSSLIL